MRGLWGVAHAYLQQAKIALGVVDKRPGTGTANTALVYHARRLMSLHEGDLPYAVRQAAYCGQCTL
jgi:carotenoid cleavage dioxygenase-like enzyme